MEIKPISPIFEVPVDRKHRAFLDKTVEAYKVKSNTIGANLDILA